MYVLTLLGKYSSSVETKAPPPHKNVILIRYGSASQPVELKVIVSEVPATVLGNCVFFTGPFYEFFFHLDLFQTPTTAR